MNPDADPQPDVLTTSGARRVQCIQEYWVVPSVNTIPSATSFVRVFKKRIPREVGVKKPGDVP